MSGDRVTREVQYDGAVWRVCLDHPKGNIIDRAMISALGEIYRQALESPELKAVVLEGEGRHFSFGASVEEHLPGEVEAMLPEFHGLFRQMFRSGIHTSAVVRGQCLGGGMELVLFCHRIYADATVMMGQPEIRLGVFAPVASALLPNRVSPGLADDLLLTGRILDAEEALACGLVDEVSDDPSARAMAYLENGLLPHSASSLRLAVRAARQNLEARFDRDVSKLEKLYLTELMTTDDAQEGVRSFLEKRVPEWRNR